jgi:outer membrane protein insertion porin family
VQAFPGGRFRFRNVDYELEQGDLTLGGLREEQPRFDVRARTSVRDYEIVLTAEGTLERFDYELTSRPPLSNQDIVSLLVTGQTLEEIAGPTRQTPRGDLAAAYFGGAVGQALFGGVAQQVLGLDRFEIRPSAIGASGKPTTRITLGKRVTDDLLFLYSRDISAQENDIYQMEYALGRSLRLFAEQSGQGTYGGDLRYTLHHGEKKRSRRLAEGASEIGTLGGVTVVVDGDLPPAELERILKLREGRPLTRALLTEAEERLRLDLARRGYLEATLSTRVEEGEEEATVHVEVTSGRRYEVIFDNVVKEADDLRRHLAPVWSESLFSLDVVEDARAVVEEYYRQRGYFNAFVELAPGDPRETGTIRFLVDRGPLVKVAEVRIEGNEAIPDDRVRRSLLTEPSSLGSELARTFFRTRRGLLDPRTLAEDEAAVARLYRESGFLGASVEVVPLVPAEGDQAIVVVRIEEGDPVLISRIDFVGKESFREGDWSRRELRDEIELPADRRLTQSLPLQIERTAVKWMDERGYPEARARVSIHPEEAGVRLDVELIPGEYQVVGSIRVEGNRTTKEKVIRRELALEEGKPLTRADLLESQHRLYRTGLFVSVRLEAQAAEPGAPPELRPILVSVQEGSRFTSLYGVGYDTEEGPRVTLGLTDGNFLGRDHVASGQIRYGSLERRAVLTWEQPRFFGTPLESLVSAFGVLEKRESFDLRRVGATAQLTKRHGPDRTSFLTYQLDQIRLTDLKISLDEFLEEEPRLDPIRLGSLGYAFALDQRDNPFSSRKGLFTSAEARLFAGPLASERDFWKLTGQGSWFQPGGPFILATGLRLGFARPFGDTDLVPIAERYFAGGATTIRGFTRDTVGPKDPITGNPLGGEGLFLFNQEARFPIWKSFHGALFLDAGNVYLRLSDFDLGDLRYTTGLSLRLGTPVGPLRVGYGYKLNRREGESKGEWYVALGQAF